MPISLHIHNELTLHVIDFDGDVTFPELRQLAMLHALPPDFAAADTIHIIAPTADMSAVSHHHVDELRAHYRALEARLDLMVLRRSSWICSDARTLALIEYWLAGRLDGQGTEIRLLAKLSDTDLFFDSNELEAVATRSGFKCFARFIGDAVG